MTTTKPLTLVIIAGPSADPIEVAPSDVAVLGRSADASARLPDETVSRRHARLESRESEWYVTDLGSRHGTFVNGVRLDPQQAAPLHEADLLRLGPYTFRVQGSTATPSGMSTEDDLGSSVQRVQRVPAAELQRLAQQRLDLLLECAASINATRTVEELAEAVLESVCTGTGFPRAALVRRISGEDEIEVVGHIGFTETGAKMTFSRSLIRAASSGEIVRLAADTPMNYGESIVQLGIHSALCAPVFLDETVAAYIYLDARNQESNVSNDAAAFAQAIARMSGLALANVNRRELESRQKTLIEDLNAAREAQKLLMPPPQGTLGQCTYSMYMRPGRFVAGDMYDVMKFPDGKVGVFLGDVTGKGVSAAILMATAQTRLRSALMDHGDPGDALNAANHAIASQSASGRFISLWIGIIDPQTREVRYVDAGHGHWLRNPPGAAPYTVESPGGLPLGIDPDFTYETDSLTLDPGDRIVVFSDGIIEQQSPKGEEFGLPRAIEALEGSTTPDTDVNLLKDAVVEFAQTDSLADDLTVASIDCG